ncbi:isoprenoid synthase domain-containing protein [Mycena rebaudengoi]|nr:isoprenoid synthase domain-containing protein [Mycena rebaudengoi]
MTITIEPEVTDGQKLILGDIIQSLLNAVFYESPRQLMDTGSSSDALLSYVNEEVESWNADDGEGGGLFQAISCKAVSVVEYFYHKHSLEVKRAFSMYAWFFFYIDDIASRSVLEDFQRSLLLGGVQQNVPGSPLNHLPVILSRLYDHWDPISANCMVGAVMEFMSGTVLEERPEIIDMNVRSAASSWPKYLRAKSGVAPGFSYAAFPRTAHRNLSAYIQAVPDIDDYLCLVNDILSFYKEELEGDTMNYVQIRARVSCKPPKQILLEMVREVGELHRRISETLSGSSEVLGAWKTLEYGFIAWHLSIERYKLSQLGLTW